VDRAAWQRLAPLIDELLDRSEGQRPAFLEELGARDPALRRELEDFLASEAASRGFLAEPVESRALLGALADDARSWDALQLEGRTVGPYRVRRELGRGGMGAVFLAERVDGGFEQRVALKLVKRGMDSADILERFRTERQILARLQHPHVARLLDGGVSADGQPYFAMEYVEGAPLTRWCDERRLGLGDRLRLFLQVCDAVDYAHRNLVVHRDLKPSNVLVTAEGDARLLDFGIAKVLEGAGPDADGEATLTRHDGRALTPQYAAPEQLRGQPVTTATDVYSLGVILYELLSGRRPYRLHGLSPGEVERVVVQEDPPPPSSAVRQADANPAVSEPAAAEIAERRGVGVERLVSELKGDLDNVVALALRKEPARRYPSASALADDLRRYLGGRPVTARADRWSYRASKFVGRHRVGVAAAAVVALSLAAGVAIALWQAREALRQASRAEEVKRFTFSLFELSDPDAAKGKEITARQLLDRGAVRVESELAGEPDLQAEMLLFLGNIYHRLSLDEEGRPLREKALVLRRAAAHPDELAVSEAELAVGWSLFSLGKAPEAQQHFERALETRARRLGEDHPQTALARALLGRARFDQGDSQSAESLLRQAVEALQRRQPGSEELATNLTALGVVLQARGDLAGAETAYRQGLDQRRALFGEEHSQVAASLYNLGTVMKDRGDLSGAETQLRLVLPLHRRLLGPTHEVVANDLHSLGSTLLARGALVEGEAVLRESLAVRVRLYGADSPRLAVALHAVAQALRLQGRLPEAESLSRQALALAVAQLGEDHPNVAAVREELGNILRERGRLAEAEELEKRALAVYRQRLGPDHFRVASALVSLAQALMAAGRPAEAEALLREALGIRVSRFGESDWRTAEARLRLGECLGALGRGPEAALVLALGRRDLEAKLGPGHPLTIRAAGALAELQSAAAGPAVRAK
jgi:eukaryotic-like serine/threonine-protein kinase